MLLAVAFWAGSLVKAPSDVALNNAKLSVPVTFPISMKVVDKQLTLKGSVVRGQATAVHPSVSSGAARQVVTKPGPAVGTEVAPGSFLGSVGGHPIFLLPDYVPLYRDLDTGDSGDDVTELQKALQAMGFGTVTASGTFDAASRDAIKQIYMGDGLKAPDKPPFSWQDFAQIPGNKGMVTSTAGLASLVDDTSPLVMIQTTADVLVARASIVDADAVAAGNSVRLSVGDQSVESSILSVGAFTEKVGANGEGPGKDITISVPRDGSSWLVPEKIVNVQRTSVPQPRLAVPLIAIQHDGVGSFIELESTASGSQDASQFQRADVTVSSQSSGWAAVDSKVPLAVGQKVRVP
ncbi:peptidoglycan-binding domain-containing protein [Paenarthrobacter sp. NPDC089316]|uniref:peptidoglycan-binding domain-containing protein n=1 Tax=unclassified Paenarthrobacter TaxID=2634190 RepID=UPI003416454A